jgi:uncharacterized membrane protein
MSSRERLTYAALVFNFALICLATYLCVVYNWSLWTYLGFALFMVNMKDKDETEKSQPNL